MCFFKFHPEAFLLAFEVDAKANFQIQQILHFACLRRWNETKTEKRLTFGCARLGNATFGSI